MPPPLLQLKDIALTFGGTPLLTGAELSVLTGERVCLVGRNGSGKSTLLRIAAGAVTPDRGSVFVQPGASLRYLPQEPDFGDAATTLAYVESGLGPDDGSHQARQLLERLGLDGSEDPAHLSGGEARRAALARALAPDPDILLLDEPTNHLDLEMREALAEALSDFEGAIVLVSHDRHLTGLVCDTFWRVADGKVEAFDGDLDDYAAWLRSRGSSSGSEAAKGKAAATKPAKQEKKAPSRR